MRGKSLILIKQKVTITPMRDLSIFIPGASMLKQTKFTLMERFIWKSVQEVMELNYKMCCFPKTPLIYLIN